MLVARDRRRLAPAAIASMIAWPRRRIPDGWMPRICSSAAEPDGWRLASSTSGGSASTEPTGRSSSDAVRSRQAASSRATARARGSSWSTRGRRSQAVSGSRSSVARLEPAALLAGPLEPAGLAQAPLQLVGELEQVGDVLGGVAELLGGQRPRVPARVAGGLADALAEDRAEQVPVPGLRARAREPGRELRVEDVRELGVPRAAQDRHVLAAGVQHDLDRRVGQQLRQRRRRRASSSASIRMMRDRRRRRRDRRPTICTRHSSAR